MTMKVFSIYDAKAGVFGRPLCFHNAAVASRWFADQVNKEGNELAAHPEDYHLFALGDFDDAKGYVNNLTAPQSLGLGSEFIVRN